MKTIAFLGLGAMGSRMATHLIKAGHELTAWNRSPEATQALASLGSKVAAHPRDAARGADIVISMVRDDLAAQSVWLDPTHGALGGIRRDAIAIECSTLTVGTMAEIAHAATARGVRFIDAPVAGSRPQAEAAQLIFMAGGAAADIAEAEPVLKTMGSSVQHAGDTGAGAAVKLLVNALFASQVAAMGELLGFARKLGLDPQRVLDILASTPTLSPAAKGASLGMLAKNYAPQFPIELARKDMGYALDLARTHSAELPMTSRVNEVLLTAASRGYADRNLTVLAELY
jgi:3-hydroxyisobutyrate dehydrogenase